MKKVLIIARYHGTRVPGLLKYLAESGYQPILLTSTAWPEEVPPDANVVRTPQRETLGVFKRLFGLKSQEEIRNRVRESTGTTSSKSFADRLMTFGGEIINYPDGDKGWKSPAVKAGDELLGRGDIDAIISSSSPVTGHIIAHELKKKYGVPWLADLRDLWSQNHNYSYSRVRRAIDKRLEMRTLAAADALVTVSGSWADKLKERYGDKAENVITNGFDPENTKLPPADVTEKFTITHTGNIYEGKQDPERLLGALEGLINKGKIDVSETEVRFYGPRLNRLDKAIDKYYLKQVARQYGAVKHDEAIDRQRESQVLLLLDWDSPGEKGVLPLKVFEYLAAGRPMLATGGNRDSAIDSLLKETGGGIHATGTDEIKKALLDYYREYKQKGKTDFKGKEAEISKYSQREMAGKFADILNRITDK